MIFEFGRCVLDSSAQELRRDGEIVHVEPQVFAVLEHLAVNNDRVVTKIELLDEVWGDRFVSESALTSRIKLARKACGDNGRDQRILKTVHSRGYRMVAPVEVRPYRRGESTPRSPAPATSTPSTRASTTVFGRNEELSELEDALDRVNQGERRVVFVSGPMGSGKSTLLAEFVERQDRSDELLIARGQCIKTRSGVEPYFCLLDAIGRLARDESDLVREVLDRVAPSWLAQMPSLLGSGDYGRLERRLLGSQATRMLREGADAIDALACERCLVLVLEDLHWADDCTLDVIDLLLHRTDATPLLLLGTFRKGDASIGSLVGTAAAAGRADSIELGPLDSTSIRELTRDRLEGAELPDQLVSVIVERCGGIPLFAEEIVASWVRQGHVRVDDGRVTVIEGAESLAATLPPSLRPLIENELAALEPRELEILEVSSVAGEAFAAAAVATASGESLATTESTLAGLSRRRGLIGATGAASWPDGTVSATYAFTHQLFREVLYDCIPPSRRIALHGAIGRALAASHGDLAPELAVTLAEHFVEAHEIDHAVNWLREAGEQANARGAHAHAAEFLGRALEQLRHAEQSETHRVLEAQVRVALGPALVATKGWFDASVSSNYERALHLCGNDPTCAATAAAARYGLANVSELQGRFERTEELLTPLLDAHRPGELPLEAHELVACSTFHQGRFDHSLRTSSAVLASWDEDAYSVLMARIAEHPASSCSSWASLALWALGRSDESLALAERAVALGEQNRYALSTAVQQRALLHQLRDEPGACIHWADRCRRVGEEQDFVMRTIQADLYKGWALGVSGSTKEGLELITGGLERFRAAGAMLNEAYTLGLLADVVLHDDDPDRAVELVREAFEVSNSRTYFYESELWRLRACALLAIGTPKTIEQSRTAFDTGLEVARRQGSPAFELRVLNHRIELAGEYEDVTAWVERLRDVLVAYQDQAPTPDTERSHAILRSRSMPEL